MLFFTLVLKLNLKDLYDEEVKDTIGALYLDLDVENRKGTFAPVWTTPLFFLRRIVYTLGILGFFIEHPLY
jgi:hypothetical protein